MGKVEDTIEERENWHWRNSMRPVRFFMMDARAAIPFLVFIGLFSLDYVHYCLCEYGHFYGIRKTWPYLCFSTKGVSIMVFRA